MGQPKRVTGVSPGKVSLYLIDDVSRAVALASSRGLNRWTSRNRITRIILQGSKEESKDVNRQKFGNMIPRLLNFD